MVVKSALVASMLRASVRDRGAVCFGTRVCVRGENVARRNGMGKVIAIANQKGGVGKTTTAINLGGALAAIGKRVLCLDLDPQANLTVGLGIDLNGVNENIANVLIDPDI